MQDYFSPRKKAEYSDEFFTVLPTYKSICEEEIERLDGFSIHFIYEDPYSSNGATDELAYDGTLTLKGIFVELEQERAIRLENKLRKRNPRSINGDAFSYFVPLR